MKRNLMAFTLLMALFGCSSEKKESTTDLQDKAVEDVNSILSDTSSASSKLIKTADLRFRVKDALKTKREISAQVKQYQGSLIASRVENFIEKTERVKYKPDSLKEVTLFSTEGKITARIPQEYVDQFTDEVAAAALFIDQQSLLIEDKRIDYLTNKAKSQNRAAIIEQAGNVKVKKKADLEQALQTKDDYVDKMANNLQIDNQTKYSTITLSFYQNRSITKTIIANDELSAYSPGFFERLLSSFENGWIVLQEVVLFITNLWTVLLAGGLIWLLIKQYKNRYPATGKTT